MSLSEAEKAHSLFIKLKPSRLRELRKVIEKMNISIAPELAKVDALIGKELKLYQRAYDAEELPHTLADENILGDGSVPFALHKVTMEKIACPICGHEHEEGDPKIGDAPILGDRGRDRRRRRPPAQIRT